MTLASANECLISLKVIFRAEFVFLERQSNCEPMLYVQKGLTLRLTRSLLFMIIELPWNERAIWLLYVGLFQNRLFFFIWRFLHLVKAFFPLSIKDFLLMLCPWMWIMSQKNCILYILVECHLFVRNLYEKFHFGEQFSKWNSNFIY